MNPLVCAVQARGISLIICTTNMKNFPRFTLILLSVLFGCSFARANSSQNFEGRGWSAEMDGASLIGFIGSDGQSYIGNSGVKPGPVVMYQEGNYPAEANQSNWIKPGQLSSSFPVGDAKAEVLTSVSVDKETDELLIRQEAVTSESGLAGVAWTLGPIDLDAKIIVPAGGGTQLDIESPESNYSFNYPQIWEAQLVIVDAGQGRGFYVWNDDTTLQFKRLQVMRQDDGWYLTFCVFAMAPFEEVTTLSTPTWRLGLYEDGWRTPASHYRQWRDASVHPTLLVDQSPDWVREARVQVLTDGDLPRLEALAEKVDPKQVLLYLLHWRKQEFDRDYPEYSDMATTTMPLIKRAHELGFRVMLHVNHFSVSDNHPSMETYADVIARKPFGDHERLKYANTRVNPPIINYYVNPASKVWRKDFIDRMAALVEQTGVDALHLDQNVHAHNDFNGLIDGMTYPEGVVALHRELRERLPDVALCGEGVNELTFPYLAFAQRTVWTAMRGTIDRLSIDNGHPISSFLLRPYVKFVGWPGYPSGYEQPQVYAAWWEDYRDWGVLPSLKILRRAPQDLLEPQGFFRQQLDEARFWTENCVDQNVNGPWADDVAFPFVTQHGLPVLRMKDRSTVSDGKEISRTITGVSSSCLPGKIDGWLFYNEQAIFGLDPDQWYPYFTEPRDLQQFHITGIPAGRRPDLVLQSSDALLVRFAYDADSVMVDLGDAPEGITGGLRLANGEEKKLTLPIERQQNASLFVGAGVLRLTPPGTVEMNEDKEGDLINTSIGFGEVFLRYAFDVPTDGLTHFVSDVGIDGRAEKKSDGMDFTVIATAESQILTATAFNDHGQRKKLNLDLTLLAGERVTLTLLAGSGPAGDVTKDEGLWYHPRVINASSEQSEALAFVPGESPWQWLAADGKLSATKDLPQTELQNSLNIKLDDDQVLFLRNRPYEILEAGVLDPTNISYSVLDRYDYVKASRGGMSLGEVGQGVIPQASIVRVDIPVIAAKPDQLAGCRLEFTVHSIKSLEGLKCRLQFDGKEIPLGFVAKAAIGSTWSSEPLKLNNVHLLSLIFDNSRSRKDVNLSSLSLRLKP